MRAFLYAMIPAAAVGFLFFYLLSPDLHDAFMNLLAGLIQ
jgi:hypothetical protein